MRHSDVRNLEKCVSVLFSDTEPGNLAARLLQALAVILPDDVTAGECFSSTGSWSGRMFADPIEPVESSFPAFISNIQQHPFFDLFVSSALICPARISDVSTRIRFRASKIYNEFFRPLRINHQIGVMLPNIVGSTPVLVIGRKRSDSLITKRNSLELLSLTLRQRFAWRISPGVCECLTKASLSRRFPLHKVGLRIAAK